MREASKALLVLCGISLVILSSYSMLVLHPGSLLVDPRRPSVDHAMRGATRSVGNDLTGYLLPRLYWIQRSIKSQGRPSFWDPSGFGGRPLVGNPQAGLFYPFAWPVMALGGPSSLGWLTLGHLVLCGFGLFRLATAYQFSTIASFTAAICFAVSPYLTGQVFEGHYPHVWAACWYPWAFYYWKSWFGGSRFALICLPLVLSLCFLTGHSQEWYYLVIAMSGLTTYESGRRFHVLKIRGLIGRCGVWVAIIGLTLGLCSIEIMPDVFAQRSSIKVGLSSALQDLLYRIDASNLLQWLHPFALGSPDSYTGPGNYWETQLSIGLTPLVLVCFGLTSIKRRVELKPWILLLILGILFAAGPKFIVYKVASALVPGMSFFRVNSRILFLVNLAACLVLASGVDSIRESGRDSLRFIVKIITFALLALILILVGSYSFFSVETAKGRLVSALLRIAREPIFWVEITSVIVFLAALLRSRVGEIAARRMALLAVLGAIAHCHEILKIGPIEMFAQRGLTGIRGPLEFLNPAGNHRIATMESLFSDLNAAQIGLEKATVNDSFQDESMSYLYERLYPFLEPKHPPGWGSHPMDQPSLRYKMQIAQGVFKRMSVDRVAAGSFAHFEPLDQVGSGVKEGREFAIWKDPDPLPHAYVVPHCMKFNPTLMSSPNWLRDISPRDFVLLESNDPLERGVRQSFRAARYVSPDADHVQIDLRADAPGFLVITNTYNPGWNATDNGNPTALYRGNYGQQVIALAEPGLHHVELQFEPVGFRFGFALSVSSILIWVGAAFAARRWDRSMLNPSMAFANKPFQR